MESLVELERLLVETFVLILLFLVPVDGRKLVFFTATDEESDGRETWIFWIWKALLKQAPASKINSDDFEKIILLATKMRLALFVVLLFNKCFQEIRIFLRSGNLGLKGELRIKQVQMFF